MTSLGPDREPLDHVAEEFAERYRRGERPSLSEYTRKHPELAEQIRELFPALVMLEEFGTVDAPATDPLPTQACRRLVPSQLGEFRILREVGRGGMGVVYEAVQESLGRHVALKVMTFQGPMSLQHRERFRREAQAAAQLHHTNIVPVFAVGEYDGVPYYAMQFIRGQGLDSILQEVRKQRKTKPSPTVLREGPEARLTFSVAQGLLTGQLQEPAQTEAEAPPEPAGRPSPLEPLPSEDPGPGIGGEKPAADSGSHSELTSQKEGPYFRGVARVGAQVAEALAYANQHGIQHRDIKPANLLLDAEGAVWITDFGLAKIEGSDDLTSTGQVLGTLGYMAPERFQGLSDPRSDIYSLGVTLYEMITLRRAFADTDKVRLMRRVVLENPAPLRQLEPRIPLDLETIIVKAMAKEPADRYATARALAEDLRRFLDNRPIRARRPSFTEQARRWCRRNPALAASSGLTLLALLAACVLAVGLAIQESRAAWKLASEQEKTLVALNAADQLSARLAREEEQTLAALKHTQQLSADLTVDKSLTMCEQGDIGPGMLWLAHCLELATQADAVDLQEAIRANLSVWRHQLSPLRGMLAHPATVSGVAMSPDGQLILTGCWDGAARLWNAHTAEPVGTPMRQHGMLRSVAFSPDGKTLVAGGGDETLGEAWLREVSTGRPLLPQPLRHAGQVRSVAFRPNGKWVATSSIDHTTQIWDVRTGHAVLKEPLRQRGQIHAVTFSPDGQTILTGCLDGTACLWDAVTGKQLHEFRADGSEVRAVAFSPDGQTVLAGTLTGKVMVWEAATGKPRLAQPLHHPASVHALAFSPDGKVVLAGSVDGTVQFWDPHTWQPMGRPLKNRSGVQAAIFGPDSREVLTGTGDGMARLWQLSLGDSRTSTLAPPGGILAAAFSPDARRIVTGSDDGTARLWSADTGEPQPEAPLHHREGIEAVTFSPDGRLVMTGSMDKTGRLWLAASGAPVGPLFQHKAAVWTVAFRPDRQMIATSDSDGIVHFWEPTTGKPLLTGDLPFQGLVRAMTFSPDGRILLVGRQDGGAQLWKAGTTEPLGPPMPHQGGCWAVAFSPDGQKILTGSGDGTAQLWETASGKPIGPALPHHSKVSAVGFSPNGHVLLTGSGQGMVRLWHATTGKAIGPPMQLPSWAYALAFTPDGQAVLASDGGTVLTQSLPGPVHGELERVVLWTQVITGMERDADGAVRVLDALTWHQRRQRLQELGGPPTNEAEGR